MCSTSSDADAAEQAAARGLSNATFVVRDAAALDATSAYDLITAFDAIHDQADPRGVLRRIREALRPDGTFLMADIAASSHLERNLGNPLAPLLFTISTMHCTTVSLAAGGEGLGEGDPLNIYFRCGP